MKIGSAVLGIHIAVLCVFSLTQGCVTSETQGSGRGAGARHKGPFKHEYKAKTTLETTGEMGSPQNFGAGTPMDPGYTTGVSEATSGTVLYVPPVKSETYIVRKGDILSQLAVDFDTTTAELVRLNGLSNPDVLYVGQELRVPAGRGGSSKAPSSSSSKSSSSVKKGGTYTIQKGDTLSGIAVAAGVSINDLRALNNIQGDKIMAGETLDIPAGGKVPSATKKASTKKSETKKTETKSVVGEPTPSIPSLAPLPAETAVDPDVVPVEPSTTTVDTIAEYVVYPGETLDDLARANGVSKAEIMRLNGITDENENIEGRTLRIPVAE